MKKYWIDTAFNYGDFKVPKLGFFEKDENGNNLLFWIAYEDLKNYNKNIDEVNVERLWGEIDAIIEDELGFLPDYEVN